MSNAIPTLADFYQSHHWGISLQTHAQRKGEIECLPERAAQPATCERWPVQEVESGDDLVPRIFQFSTGARSCFAGEAPAHHREQTLAVRGHPRLDNTPWQAVRPRNKTNWTQNNLGCVWIPTSTGGARTVYCVCPSCDWRKSDLPNSLLTCFEQICSVR